MPRVGLNQRTVVREAARLADEVGADQLTLAALAHRLGVALPSLYKHVRGAEALAQKLSALATAELADELTTAAAGRAGGDALRAVAAAYRSYAHRHPGRYPTTQRVPDPTDPEHVAAGERAVGAIRSTLRGYGFDGDDTIDATRMLRSTLHGFVSLEAAGGFGLPRAVDASFAHLVAALDGAFRSWPRDSDR
ncbi:WHG domain-containing protein [Micromonospora peucetia]|uniref:Transcriptional regulator, TetR family n=1 Tax=Micromonospora peucetia TaxID=47871 RepID=A0A1C6V6S6_9ACTN|nr:TetR/AcrR family transcriptional regulator [Micromonospora peucetia]MCX4389294.1 WHG domain-containing protein [Micromonospora peucetia]WSA35478.1 WHG domain-containing protein [Micromonospora peucetia]SCL62062.1 transcriptional regulator, TetR family [Micromonospora peucetia]